MFVFCRGIFIRLFGGICRIVLSINRVVQFMTPLVEYGTIGQACEYEFSFFSYSIAIMSPSIGVTVFIIIIIVVLFILVLQNEGYSVY